MATERIALVIFQHGLIATRDKLTLVRGKEELIANMYRIAPDVQVVYILSMSHSFSKYFETVKILKAVGFKNIKLVNTTSWFNTEQMQRLPVTWVVGECIAFFPHFSAEEARVSFTVYKKTDNGFEQIGDSEIWQVSHFPKCPELKHVVVMMDSRDFSESEQSAIKNKFPCQTVHFIGNKGRNWLKCIWDEYDGKVQNFLPALYPLDLRFKYGNSYHLEKIDYSELPFEKTFELDIDNALELETSVHFNFTVTEHLKTYKFLAGKSRNIKIDLKVGFDFIPDIVVIITSEKDNIEGIVYCIDFVRNYHYNRDESDDDSESVVNDDYFTGMLITSDGATVVVERSNDISDVFKQLDAKKGPAKLRGVFVDYPKHITFPLDAHRAVVNALPSPKTKVCVGRTHSEWTIHLWNSRVELQVGEYVVIANWITYNGPYKQYIAFLKTENGLKAVDIFYTELPNLPFNTVVVIVKSMERHFEDLAESLFPSKTVIFSEESKLPKNVRHDFAWQYFNGMDFYGYMILPYRGVSIHAFTWHTDIIDKFCDSNCGTFKNRIAILLDKSHNNVFGMLNFSATFLVSAYYIGYKMDAVIIEIPTPESDFVHLKISINEKFVPTVTYTEANSPLFSVDRHENVTDRLQNASDHQNHLDELEKTTDLSDSGKVVVSPKKSALHKSLSIKSPSDAVESESPCVVLVFTQDNLLVIYADSDFTGDFIFPTYFRLRYINGIPEFLVGAKAKKTTKRSRKHLIYDIPSLLAANLNPDRENAAWTFDTSRADDGSLLIHLNSKDTTSPIVVFGHVVRAAIQYINDHQPMKVTSVGIGMPSDDLITIEELSAVSSKLGVTLCKSLSARQAS